MTNKEIGKLGEQLAKNFLIEKGYKILDMNFHFSKMAEIDIIAKKDSIIHFVEVKTRTQTLFGVPLEAITRNKLISIYNNSKEKFKKLQIDAIGIILDKNGNHKIDFIEDICL